MSPRLHVIMSFSRPQYVDQLFRFWLCELEPHPFELRLHVMRQGPEPDPKGVRKANEALDQIPKSPDHWVMFSSDDTVHPPQVLARIGQVLREKPNCLAIVVAEDRGPRSVPAGILVATPETMVPCQVDGTQVLFRGDFINDFRLDLAHGEQADGYFIRDLFARAPSRFIFVDEVLVRFNSLQW